MGRVNFVVFFEPLLKALESFLKKNALMHMPSNFAWNFSGLSDHLLRSSILSVFHKPLKRHKQRALELKGRGDHKNLSKSRKVLYHWHSDLEGLTDFCQKQVGVPSEQRASNVSKNTDSRKWGVSLESIKAVSYYWKEANVWDTRRWRWLSGVMLHCAKACVPDFWVWAPLGRFWPLPPFLPFSEPPEYCTSPGLW